MSGTKFFIHGGGTWREVDENNGRVSGWGKIQFVYLSRGRLVVARRNSVLRGLKALLAGKPTTVRDGSRLQVIRPKVKKERKIQQIETTNCICCTCQHAFHHNHQFATDILFNKLLKQNTSSTATQCVLTPDSPVEVIQNVHTEQSRKHTEETEKRIETEDNGKCTETEESEPVPAKPLETHKVPRKELIIDEDDILLVRTFIEHDRRNIFNISLVDYDANDDCKRSVFYKINPLVVVEKSSQIAQMIRPPSQCSSVSLQEFIAHLGLRSIHEVSKSSKYRMRQRKSHQSLKVVGINNSDTDKENMKTSTSRTNINNRAEKRLTKTSLLESKLNKIQNKEKTHHDEPLKLKVTSDLRKLSGVRNNSLLNMRRRLRADKNMKINKIEARDSVDGSKTIAEDENILHKSLNSRRHTADKTLLTRSNNRNQSTKVSSDLEREVSSGLERDKEKNNSVDVSRNLGSVTRDRPTVPIDKKSRATEESTKKSAIDKIQLTKQLSASLPTKATRNKITVLPIEPSSDEDTFQEDKTKGKAKSKNGINQPNTSSKQQNSKPEHDRKISQKPNTSSRGRATEESTKKSAIDKIKLTKQLSASLPTKTTRNKIPKLPIEPSSDEDTFQEDKTKGKAKSKNGINQPNTSSKQQNSKPEHDRKISQKPNTSSSRGVIRAYSRAEDEAIVSWLKMGVRANLVNGNRIWKELKPEHHKTTGHHRPWQSLRNRYLRYILPALSSLAVPPALAQKLRAAAAKGEIKSRSNSKSANNSIFKSAPARSAWALRSKSLLRSPPSSPASIHKPSSPTPPTITSQSLRNNTQTPTASTSKTVQQPDESESDSSDTSGAYRAPLKRKLRSSTVQSPTLPTPEAKDRRDSLTYSELTRRFASRHRSTPNSDASSEQRRRDSSESADQSNSSGDSDDDVKTKRVTRKDSRGSPSLLSGKRRSTRLRSMSATPERPKTRRLYNPRAI